ncbi:MAG TPA: hypothetical protein VI197_17940 [Polyangiaceae bacterium]
MTRRTLQVVERFFEPGAPSHAVSSNAVASNAVDTIARRFELGGAILAQRDECSLRELSKALGGRVSRTFLHRCTTAYRLGKSFPFILQSPHLRVSHLDAVERLARPVQGRLLLEADQGGWSVRKLRERAVAERAPSNSSVNIKAARRALAQLRLSLSALVGHEPFTTAATLATLEEICLGLSEARELSAHLLGSQRTLNA